MQNFLYGSRVIENERTVSMRTHMKNFGKTVGNIVRFFVVFCAFALLSFWLKTSVRHIDFSLQSLNVLQESMYVLANENAVSIFGFVYQHIFSILSVILGCVALWAVYVYAYRKVCACIVRTDGRFVHSGNAQSSEAFFGAVAYRQKVKFLS